MSVMTTETLNFTATSGNEPVLRYLPNGTAVCNLSLCVDRLVSRDDNGQPVTAAFWYGVPVFGQAAEALAQRVKKGTIVQVRDAVPNIRTYVDKEGITQYRQEAIHGFVVALGNLKLTDDDGFPA